jgi:hypothetical protein
VKVIGAEPGHGLAVTVGDEHVQDDQLGAARELRLLLRRSWVDGEYDQRQGPKRPVQGPLPV